MPLSKLSLDSMDSMDCEIVANGWKIAGSYPINGKDGKNLNFQIRKINMASLNYPKYQSRFKNAILNLICSI